MKYCLRLFMYALALVVSPSFAHDHSHGDIMIDHPWSRATPPGTSMGVAYMGIANSGSADVTLVGAETPLAGRVSIHETRMQEGMMRMQPIADGLNIPAGASVELKPQSFHLMLERLNGPLKAGESVPLTLFFEGAEDMQIELRVEGLDGKMSSQSMGSADDHKGHAGHTMHGEHGGHSGH